MTGFEWPDGAAAAFSFTFDDARFSQIDTGIPLLNELGVNATFFVSPAAFEQRVDQWRQVFEEGHEIAAHTASHPCSENFAFGRKQSLESMTLEMIRADCEEADELIRSKIGVKPATFAYPCGQTYVGRGTETQSYVPVVAERYRAARSY